MATKKTTKRATSKGTRKEMAPARKSNARAARKPTPTANRPAAKRPAIKLSQMAAAVRVLHQAKEPLTCKQMVEAMAKKGLWQSPGGKTPDQTLYASILRDIQKHGDASRFQKVNHRLFTLASKLVGDR